MEIVTIKAFNKFCPNFIKKKKEFSQSCICLFDIKQQKRLINMVSLYLDGNFSGKSVYEFDK